MRVGIVILLFILLIGFVFLWMNRSTLPAGVLATVNNEPVYTTYLDKELAFYPGTKSAEVEKKLEQKIIDDQIILEAGQKEGLIKTFPDGPSLTNDEYLERTKLVADIRNMIEKKANGTDVAIVSIWFHNGSNGEVGYVEGKEIALSKITSLYEKVQKKEITLRQAGELIATDPTLEALNTSSRENAYTTVKAKAGEEITFWPEFDKEIMALKPGEVTKVFTGTDTTSTGETIPILYSFAGVDDIKNDSDVDAYTQWVEKNKKEAKISYE